MADSNLASLTETTALSDGDLFYVVRDPDGTPVDRKVKSEKLLPLLNKRTMIRRLNGSNYSVSPAALSTIDDTNLPITLTLAVGDVVELMFRAPLGLSAAGNVIGIDWEVDRPTSGDITSLANHNESGVYASGIYNFGNNGYSVNSTVTIETFTCAEAGAHIFKPRWRVSSGTGYILCADPNYPGSVLHTAKVI